MMEADILKTAAIRLDRIFRRRGMGASIVMVIHDALWVECPEEEAEQVRHLVRSMMTTAGNLIVPLEVEFRHQRRFDFACTNGPSAVLFGKKDLMRHPTA